MSDNVDFPTLKRSVRDGNEHPGSSWRKISHKYSVKLTKQLHNMYNVHKPRGGVGVEQTNSHRFVAASSFARSLDYRTQGVQIILLILFYEFTYGL